MKGIKKSNKNPDWLENETRKNYIKSMAYILRMINTYVSTRQLLSGEIVDSVFAEVLNNDLAALVSLITNLR